MPTAAVGMHAPTVGVEESKKRRIEEEIAGIGSLG
jgi:hypothetical protein